VVPRAFKRSNRRVWRGRPVVVCALRAYLLARQGAASMFKLFGKNETDGLARLAGILYLLVLPTAGPWYYTSTALLGADATPDKIEASRGTLELMILLGAAGHTLQLLAAVLLYLLLKPTAKVAGGLALILLAVSVPLSFTAIAYEIDLLALLRRGGSELQSQITSIGDAYTSVISTAALFWGLWLFPLGWALFRSPFVPRVIGVLVMLGGPLYIQSFVGPLFDASYATSSLSGVIGLLSGIPDLIGEIGTGLWFAIMGARWQREVIS
jgi:uncharacterized protein DUF4386